MLNPLLLVPPALLGRLLVRLPQSVDSREDEQKTADIVADLSQQPCESSSQEQSQDGHQRLEEAEDHSCFEPCVSIDAGEANANSGREEARGQEKR
jgi:hypothetical protein